MTASLLQTSVPMAVLLLALSGLFLLPKLTCAEHAGITRHYKFVIRLKNVTQRLCHMNSIVTVNGQFPGPTIIAREGDQVALRWLTMFRITSSFTGEWFNADTEAVIAEALQTRDGPNVSDAYTINGLLGPLYNCSVRGSCAYQAVMLAMGCGC